jgi:hypothetical protein
MARVVEKPARGSHVSLMERPSGFYLSACVFRRFEAGPFQTYEDAQQAIGDMYDAIDRALGEVNQ